MSSIENSKIIPMNGKRSELQRFQFLYDVADTAPVGGAEKRPLHIVMLADDQHPANVVQDHINSIADHSDHVYTVVNPRVFNSPDVLQHTRIDAILLHYSIFALAESHLNDDWRSFLRAFEGVKVMIHEDEYQQINNFHDFMAGVGMNAVFSCLESPETLEKVYGVDALSDIHFFSCLPGYIADGFDEFRAPPMSKRKLHIVYRGRTLPAQLGRFAQEKREIGEKVTEWAKKSLSLIHI